MEDSLSRFLSWERLKSWNQAIDDRCSVRTYLRRPVNRDAIEKIEELLNGFSPLCKRARGYLVTRGASQLFTGIVGPFGKISNPPAAIAFAADVHLPGHMEAVGYLGEGVVLEATSLGLGTCWVSGTFSRTRTIAKVRPMSGWRVIAVTPLGYAAKKPTLGEMALQKLAKSDERKPLSELVTGISRKRWPTGLKRAFEAAQWAPSALNRQPWRFRVDVDGVTLSADTGDVNLDSLKRLDCGIAMLHFEVACLAEGIMGEWKLPEPGNPIIAKFKYC